MRHLENRHDVIFFCRGWSDLDKISQTGTEWHVDCGDLWKWKWANSMACHPRATYHISGCCHLVNSLSRFQSHMPHCHDHATLQGVRIPSAILKIVFRHILLFLFCLMQFRLWRSAAFVSSPIHLLLPLRRLCLCPGLSVCWLLCQQNYSVMYKCSWNF